MTGWGTSSGLWVVSIVVGRDRLELHQRLWVGE